MRYIATHPANRDRRVTALVVAAAWQASKRLTGQPWTLALPSGLRLRCHPHSTAASHAIYTRGLYDYDEMGFMEHYLRPGDSFIDVGANIGIYSLLAAGLVGPSGSVDSFEADPQVFAALQENIALNSLVNVRLHQKAVSNREGSIGFTQGNDQTGHIATNAASSAIPVTACRLDTTLSGRSFAMGKIDIEGYELQALQGAHELLKAANPPVWQLECVGRLLRPLGLQPADIAHWLAAQGYTLTLYEADQRCLLTPAEPWRFRKNILALHVGSRAMVEARLRQ